MRTEAIEEILQAVTRVLPKTPQDVKRNLHAALTGVFNRLDLVTREEFDVQQAVLERTRTRLKILEEKVAEIEQQIKQK